MSPIEILEKISQDANNNISKNIISVYRETFQSQNDIELFKLRTLLIEQMNNVLEDTSKSKNALHTFENIYSALTYNNLLDRVEKIAPLITPAHVASVEALFNLYKFKQDFEAVNEINELNTNLKEVIEVEDITTEQKNILLQICYEVDKTEFEHKIIGNNAIKKIHENITGKILIYQKILADIQNKKVKDAFSRLYTKIDNTNKLMNTFVGLVNKVENLLGWIQ